MLGDAFQRYTGPSETLDCYTAVNSGKYMKSSRDTFLSLRSGLRSETPGSPLQDDSFSCAESSAGVRRCKARRKTLKHAVYMSCTSPSSLLAHEDSLAPASQIMSPIPECQKHRRIPRLCCYLLGISRAFKCRLTDRGIPSANIVVGAQTASCDSYERRLYLETCTLNS